MLGEDHFHRLLEHRARRAGARFHPVAEARLVRETALERGVVTRTGNQGTAHNGFRAGVELIRSGTIGDVPTDEITVPVLPQLLQRQAEKAVYCSCRCDGPDEGARYCECPSGYKCTELVKPLGLPAAQLAGSYCVRNGTEYDPTNPPTGNCDRAAENCGNEGANP